MIRVHVLLYLILFALMLNCYAQTEPVDSVVYTTEVVDIQAADVVRNTSSSVISSDDINYLTRDSMFVQEKKVLSYLSRIAKTEFSSRDSVVVFRYTFKEATARFKYSIVNNGKLLWDLRLALPSPDLEALFIQKIHNDQLDSAVSQHKKKERGFYQVTPWKTVAPIFKEKGLPNKLVDMLMPDDTTEFYVNLGRPALIEYRMDMNYSHRFGIFSLGTGLERSWQMSSRFDTLYVERGGWFSRMGWNVSMAVPGFRYKLYRDPGVIPYYSMYEDSIYNRLYPDAKYSFTKKLGVVKDSVLQKRTVQYGEVAIDVEDTVDRIAPLGGLGHEFTLKAGYFNYQINIHPRAYILPIHTIGMVGMPFFKGEWAMKLIFLPNRKVIPHASIDFFRTAIPVGKNSLGISPLHIDLEVWDRSAFFGSLGFNVELLTKNATFTKEKQ